MESELSHAMITVKDKAQVLMQVEELTAVKDELTEQVIWCSLFL